MIRLFINIFILLLLGTIVNVAVAWGCAIRWEGGNSGEIRYGSTVDETMDILWVIHGKLWLGTSSFSVQGHPGYPAEITKKMTAEQAAPYWLNWKQLEVTDNPNLINPSDVIAHGLPVRSLLRLDDSRLDESESVFKTGIVKTFPDWMRGPESTFSETHLPIKPIWPGFIANSLIYSWLFMLGQLEIISLRKRRRRKRGLCIKCAYDLRGTAHVVCPECGIVPKHD